MSARACDGLWHIWQLATPGELTSVASPLQDTPNLVGSAGIPGLRGDAVVTRLALRLRHVRRMIEDRSRHDRFGRAHRRHPHAGRIVFVALQAARQQRVELVPPRVAVLGALAARHARRAIELSQLRLQPLHRSPGASPDRRRVLRRRRLVVRATTRAPARGARDRAASAAPAGCAQLRDRQSVPAAAAITRCRSGVDPQPHARAAASLDRIEQLEQFGLPRLEIIGRQPRRDRLLAVRLAADPSARPATGCPGRESSGSRSDTSSRSLRRSSSAAASASLLVAGAASFAISAFSSAARCLERRRPPPAR